jgi:hypothetical protein
MSDKKWHGKKTVLTEKKLDDIQARLQLGTDNL